MLPVKGIDDRHVLVDHMLRVFTADKLQSEVCQDPEDWDQRMILL